MGDVIKEINGQEVTDPDQLSELMRKAAGSITLKIIPSHWDQGARSQVKYALVMQSFTFPSVWSSVCPSYFFVRARTFERKVIETWL